jgi:hypothetical protein
MELVGAAEDVDDELE